jgi:hypothetical protein
MYRGTVRKIAENGKSSEELQNCLRRNCVVITSESEPFRRGNLMTFRWSSTANARLFALGLCALAVGMTTISAETLPSSTAIPIRFTHSVDANKARPGDPVTAKTLQMIVLPGGKTLPKGTVVAGHVVEISPFRFDETQYAHQQPSRVSIHFDRIQAGDLSLPVNVAVRALANRLESDEASSPHRTDETDSVGTMVLIGGGSFSPLEKSIMDTNGDAIGYNRRHGVFARLIASSYATDGETLQCGSTTTEQSIAIFSPSACGVYGFDTVYMPEGGQRSNGTFTLASRHHSVKLYAGSTALLETTEAQ